MLAEQTPASFVAFDLLALGDDDLHRPPVRRAAGRARVARWPAPGRPIHLTPTTTDVDEAQRWFTEFEGAGLDGVIAKPLDGTYQPDKRVMFKIKHDAHGRLRARRLPLAQDLDRGRAAGRVAAARPLQRRAARCSTSASSARSPPSARAELVDELEPLLLGDGDEHPWQEWAERRGAPGPAAARQRQPLERDQGPVVRAAASRAGARGASTSTWRARGSGTWRTSSAGATTARPSRAPTSSSSSRVTFAARRHRPRSRRADHRTSQSSRS